MVKDDPTTLYIYPEAGDIDAVTQAVKAGRSLSRAGLYWNASCLKEIDSPKFCSKETLEPVLAQYNRIIRHRRNGHRRFATGSEIVSCSMSLALPNCLGSAVCADRARTRLPALSRTMTDPSRSSIVHGGEAARRHRNRLPRVLQSSSASRFTAGAAGFLTLIQSFDRPNRYGEPSRFDTIPSQPSLQAFDIEVSIIGNAGMRSAQQHFEGRFALLEWLIAHVLTVQFE